MSFKDLLGIANDAPLDNNLGRFWRWVIFGGVALVGVIALLAVAFHFVNQYTMHAEKVEAVQSAPVALPDVVKIERVKPTVKTKPATVSIAAQATNTPPLPDMRIHIPEPLNQFDRDLANFESKIP